jgi:hypothetical protein
MTATEEEELPPSAQCSATCHTEEPEPCPNNGTPFEVTVYEQPDGSLAVVFCGVCDQPITDVVRLVRDAAT